MTELHAYHNDAEVKAKYVNRMQAHIAADELIRGTGWENGRGCAVGCTVHAYDHSAFPSELGIPTWVAYLIDTLHESTSNDVWPTFSLRFLEAVEPGIQFDQIYHDLCIFILKRNLERVSALAGITENLKATVTAAIDRVIRWHGAPDDEIERSAAVLAAAASSTPYLSDIEGSALFLIAFCRSSIFHSGIPNFRAMSG